MPHRRPIKQMQSVCADDTLFAGVKHIPRHVAFVFQGSELLCCATNGDGRAGDAHAEENALCILRTHDLAHHRNLRLYVTKVGGQHAFSRPCGRCSRLLARYPQLRVYYSDHNGEWLEDTRLDSMHRSMSEIRQLQRNGS